jgi:hypothetical protein
MYQSIHIQNFRQFTDFHIENLARVNLIGGRNNTGKTALLEAVALVSGHVDPHYILRFPEAYPSWAAAFQNPQQAIRLEGQTQAGEEVLIQFRLSNLLQNIEESFARFIQEQAAGGILSLEQVEILAVDYQGQNVYLYKADDRVIINRNPQAFYRLSFGAPSSSPQLPKLKKLAEQFGLIKEEGEEKMLLEALQILEPRLTRLYDKYQANIETSIIWGEVGGIRLPFASMGQGINRLLEWTLGMRDIEGGILCIDEIDNGLHHSKMAPIWKHLDSLARRFEVQIFASTHSDEMIQAARQAFSDTSLEDFMYYRLENDPLQIIELNGEELTTLDELALEIR